jgi:tripeptide aminopeptidase
LTPFRHGYAALGMAFLRFTSRALVPALAVALIVPLSPDFTHTVTERFLRYVVIDTQSDPASPTCPSTEKQKNLGRLLASELQGMGIADAHLDEHGYVYATIPATTDKKVPVICFCSHMDTSPDCTGKDVKPQLVRNYRGGDIALPGDAAQVIRAAEHPALAGQVGNDIVTSDGTTLLGADDKAGVAEIMDAAQFLIDHPEIKHGTIKILFTPDEEIGRGVDKVDLKKLGADFAYTMDGETAGNIEDETFSADVATITIEGVSAHPGFAKGKMEHAIKIAAAIVDRLPKTTCTPETTEGRQGFLHPIAIAGALERASLNIIVRDFTDQGLKEKEILLENIVKSAMTDFPRSTYRLEIKPQYRNMKQVIDRHPEIVDYAMEAIRRAGLEPVKTSIRGGTDGSRLSFMGLPCPNIFAGEHAFHSRLEWVSVQDMEKAVQTIVHLAMIWEERT